MQLSPEHATWIEKYHPLALLAKRLQQCPRCGPVRFPCSGAYAAGGGPLGQSRLDFLHELRAGCMEALEDGPKHGENLIVRALTASVMLRVLGAHGGPQTHPVQKCED